MTSLLILSLCLHFPKPFQSSNTDHLLSMWRERVCGLCSSAGTEDMQPPLLPEVNSAGRGWEVGPFKNSTRGGLGLGRLQPKSMQLQGSNSSSSCPVGEQELPSFLKLEASDEFTPLALSLASCSGFNFQVTLLSLLFHQGSSRMY